MIETLVSAVVDVAVEKAASFLTEEFLAFTHVKEEVEKLENLLKEINPRLKYVEQNLLTSSSSEGEITSMWLEKLRIAAYDAQDLMDCWATELHLRKIKTQVQRLHSPFGSTSYFFQYGISDELREIVPRLERILKGIRQDHQLAHAITDNKSRRNSSPEAGSLSNNLVVGRENDIENVIKLLIPDGGASDGSDISVIPILGMGGVGKKTLAQIVMKDERVTKFFKTIIWVSVTESFDITRILRQITASHNKTDHGVDFLTRDQLEKKVVEILVKKRFLLVLDDMWNDNYLEWEKLENVFCRGPKGSRVMVTSRISRVANIMGAKDIYSLQCFDDNESWLLFEKIAFREDGPEDGARKELEVYGKEIVRKCKGLPLAVKQMGGLQRGVTDVQEWKRIMNSEIWELEDDSVLPVLRLSYNHLSSNLKQCFAYCSLFPKSYAFDKYELIKLWMAEEFILAKKNEKTEDIGSGYFNNLVMRFFFEISSDDSTKYRMHDLIHNLAQSIAHPFCFQVKDEKPMFTEENSRHVSLLCKEVEEPVLKIINKSKKLRTLLFPAGHLKAFGHAQQKVFDELSYIRVLDLSSSTLLELPKSIQMLKLLRYLNLSKTEIKKLPNSICRLYNLETLKLLGCPWLFELPRDLSDLTNLRYLELDEMFWSKASILPPNIGRLTSLHNLHAFHVGHDMGYRLEELKNMVHLTGTLHISKLENAVNAGHANLKDKEWIQKVVYEWSNQNVNTQDKAREEEVLEELQPHSNVKEIHIFQYRGIELPTWMRNGQLQNLVTISLNHCTRIKILSPGKLPLLEEVRLKNMQELEEWQEERYLSLKRLKISHCPKLTKLPCFFPKLDDLKIKKCDLLETIPLAQLTNITLVDNPLLKHWNEEDLPVRIVNERGQEETKEVTSSIFLREVNISNCPKLLKLPENLCLDKLEIRRCRSLTALWEKKNVKYLQHLAMDTYIDDKLLSLIHENGTLYSLVISNISNVKSLPKWPSILSLKALYIHGWEHLESLATQEITMPQAFANLELLSIWNCPELLELPQEGLPTSLQYLAVGSCASLRSFGPSNVLRNLTSLKDLYIENCPALQSLPSDGLPESLQHISIHGCNSLLQQCQNDNGDLPKIKPVPDVEMDDAATSTENPFLPSLASSCCRFFCFCFPCIFS
ncbi:putative disease resistance protein RGA3 [Ziziphus jujuba]|uniref:Disease resistance protein RGA3 n=1 Tax=Ziziphus jujuba TaxID=326968 RepID=A0ABM3I1J5_ZIZJJ|nr:putative disease resistance protein RGA3 [Ziziphus jujuba]